MPDETPNAGQLEPSADASTLTAPPGLLQAQLTARPGDRFGRYKILEEIGQGGCGVVFVAEQEEPVRRRVALKVIKLGMDTRQVIARFEAERQALAMMDHPNIAKVLDAGATDTGRPFFVMELVRGIKITDYSDQNKLSTPDRLKLFIQVCQAVQHAHQKGIIHRDLKPSNILVTIPDGLPTPKVIDFGIAKATADQKLTDKTIYTAFEQFIGTPAYMSPEQAEMAGLDIDTRSDIYSLGVLLYELLVGETPFSSEELLGVGLDAMRRILREKDPTRPSTKLSTMTQADLTAIALHRQSEPPKLIKSVRGDLDWIVMKCLEKDRARRYETANGLAADIIRYLKSEPVIARPPSRLYEFQKTVHRHKFGFAAAAAVILVLAIGIVVSSYEAFRAHRAEIVANHNQQLAEIEAAKSKQVAEFLQGMLQGVGPAVAHGRDTTILREILDQSADNVSNALKNQPAVEAELETTIGKAYYAIGEDPKAKANLENAVALRRKLPGGNSVELADSLQELAMVRWRQSSLDVAEELAREALAMKKRFLGPSHPAVADSLDTLGTVLNSKNKLAESETVLREALAIRSNVDGGENLAFAETLGNLSAVLQKRGAMGEAEAMARKSLVVKKKLLDVDPSVATALNSLGYTLLKEGKLEEAEGLLREGLAMRRKLFSKEHPDLALSLINLSDTLAGGGKLEEAEGMARESLAMRRSLGLTNDLENAGYLNHVAATLRLRNKFTEAEELLREALAIETEVTKKPGRTEDYTLTQLGEALGEQGRWSEAEAVCRQETEVQKQIAGNADLPVAHSLERLAGVLKLERKFDEAERVCREALTIRRKLSPNGLELASDLAELGDALLLQSKFTEAEQVTRECLALREKQIPDDWRTFNAQSMLGGALLGQKRFAEAEPLLLSGYDSINQRRASIPSIGATRPREALQRLIELYEQTSRPEQAAEYKKKLAELEKPEK